MKIIFAVLVSVVLSLSMSSCVKKTTSSEPTELTQERIKKSPEDVVRMFIEASASAKDDGDRLKLKDLCVGEMRRTFERMTPEAFKISYLNNQVSVKTVRILENTATNDSAKVRYQVDVENKSGTETTNETNEREVDLVQSQGAWFIDSIHAKGSDKIAFTKGMIF